MRTHRFESGKLRDLGTLLVRIPVMHTHLIEAKADVFDVNTPLLSGIDVMAEV